MEILKFHESDSEAVADFMVTHFPRGTEAANRRGTGPEYYSWKFAENPFGKPVVFLHKTGKRVTGIFGAVPMPVCVRGETLPAF